MFRLGKSASLLGILMLVAGCSSSGEPSSLVPDECKTVRAGNLTSYESIEWPSGAARSTGLGTYSCNFDGFVEPTFGENYSSQLLVGESRLYKDGGLGSVGFISPAKERELMGNVNSVTSFVKDEPFQIVVTLTPKSKITKFDSSNDLIDIRFTNVRTNLVTSVNAQLAIKVGK